MGIVKRGVKASVFWLVTAIAFIANGIGNYPFTEPGLAPLVSWGFGTLFGLVIVTQVLHRILYGRFWGGRDLAKLSPIRPEPTNG